MTPPRPRGFLIVVSLLDLLKRFNRLLPSLAVGGTVRDFLLGYEPDDIDLVTPLTPDEALNLLPKGAYPFAKYGSFHLVFEGTPIDLTCLREEGEYSDFRHPSYLKFGVGLADDSVRRDFTINALYLDKDGNVYDYHQGISDLKNGVLRFIGDPYVRIKEDPLRIIRAERFQKRLNLAYEVKTGQAIEDLQGLLNKLNPSKIQMERSKE